MTTTAPHPRWQQTWILAVVLSLIAVGLNLLRIDVVFGFDLLLGSSLAVFGLLWLGDIGLLVGISTSLIAWKTWGHPWCALMILTELLWLRAYLQYFSDDHAGRINGRIILADNLYWIAIGIPVTFLLFGVVINLDPFDVLLLAVNQALNGAINTTMGFSLYLALRIWQSRRDPSRAVAIHGLTVATVMVAVILSSLTIAGISSRLLIQASHQSQLTRLQMVAKWVAVARESDLKQIADFLSNSGSLVEFERIKTGYQSQNYQSNPALFKTLKQNHRQNQGQIIQARGLELLIADVPAPMPRQWMNGYWQFDLAKADITMDVPINSVTEQNNVVVVEPARLLMIQIQRQSTRIMGTLAWCLLFAALVSEMLAKAISRQFDMTYREDLFAQESAENRSAAGQQNRQAATLRPLKSGFVLDLNHIISLANQKVGIINNLHKDLQNAQAKLRDIKDEISVLSTTDPLTGCCNRHELYRRLDFELQRRNRDSSDLSCICFEVDHYNHIRDSYGQGMAEQVLIGIVNDVQARARVTDCLCRSSESEFCLILPMCSVKAAEVLAQTFRRAVEKCLIQFEDQQISVTISIGISCLRTGNDDSESLINRAENALYRAKAEGRNRIVLT